MGECAGCTLAVSYAVFLCVRSGERAMCSCVRVCLSNGNCVWVWVGVQV